MVHAVALSQNENRFGMMQQPVKNGRCQGVVVVKDLGPIFKRAIGCDRQRALLVS